MLFDLEDFATTGWIGYGAGRRYQNDERTIANSGDTEDYATTFRAVRDAHIKVINERFNSSIHLLPINKRSIAVQKYFAWMDSLRDFHIYNTRYPNEYTKFTGMMGSLRVIPVEGGVTFNDGDLLGIKDVSELTEEEIATLPDVRFSASETGGQYKWKLVEDGWLVYVLFDQEWIDVYFDKFDAVVQAEKEMIIALEGLTENFAPYIAPVVVPTTKFKHGVSAGQTFNGTIKTTTGFVKFVIGKEEFLLGSTGSTGGVNFTIPVSATSKKSGNFISCDASGVGSGDILEIEIDSSLSSINLSNAPELTRFVATNGTFGSLSLTKNTKLTYLDVSGVVSLTSLNVLGLTLLEELYCQGCSIGTLTLTGATSLVRIEADNNKLLGVNLSGLNSLTYADFGNNAFSGSNRNSILETLDYNSTNNGTLIAPLEGRTSASDVYYNSLISRGWSLTSDGIEPTAAISYNIRQDLPEIYNSGTYLQVTTTTGYAKYEFNGESHIFGGDYAAYDPTSEYLNSAQTNFYLSPEMNHKVNVYACDSLGNLTGDIYGFYLSGAEDVDLSLIDSSKLLWIEPNNSIFDIQSLVNYPNLRTITLNDVKYDYNSTLNFVFSVFVDLSNVMISDSQGANNNIIYDVENLDPTKLKYLTVGGNINLLRSSDYLDLSGFNLLKGFGMNIPDTYKHFVMPSTNMDYVSVYGTQNSPVEILSLNIEGSVISNLYIAYIDSMTTPFELISDSNTSVGSIQYNNVNGIGNNFDVDFLSSNGQLWINSCNLLDPTQSINISCNHFIDGVYIAGFDFHSLNIDVLSMNQLQIGNSNVVDININPMDIGGLNIGNCQYLESFNVTGTGNLSVQQYIQFNNVSNNYSPGLNVDFDSILKSNSSLVISFYLYNTRISDVDLSQIPIQSINVSSSTIVSNNFKVRFADRTNYNYNNNYINLLSLDLPDTNLIVYGGSNIKYFQMDWCRFKSLTFAEGFSTTAPYADSYIYITGCFIKEGINFLSTLSNVKEITCNISYVGGTGVVIDSNKLPALASVRFLGGSTDQNLPNAWRSGMVDSKFDLSGFTSSTASSCYVQIEAGYGNVGTIVDLPESNPNLTHLQMSGRKFKNLDGSELTSIDVSGFANIQRVYISNSDRISSLTGVNNKFYLTELHMDGCPITTLDISGSTNLQYVYAAYTQWTSATTDSVLITLANNQKVHGFIRHINNRTSMSDVARQNLLNRGWTVQQQ